MIQPAALPLPAAVQADSIVMGCRDGEPLAYDKFDPPPYTEAQRRAARAAIWRERASASGLCLAMAAHEMARADLPRARELAALGFVRARWEAARCAGEEPGGQGYRFGLSVAETGVSLQDPGLRSPPNAWRAVVRAVAEAPSTYAYAVPMAKVCGAAAVRPEAEWPALRDKLQAAIVAATDKPAP